MSRVHDISKRGGGPTSDGEPLSDDELEAHIHHTAGLFAAAAQPRARETSDEARQRAQQRAGDAVRGLLRDELTIVSRLEGPDGIDPQEKERQLARRALAHLSKLELRRAAKAAGLRVSGSKPQLLDRLMLDIGENRTRVSRILDSIDRQPRRGRRHASRLFTFDDLPDAAAVGNQLAAYEERYVRTGIASWFILQSVVAGAETAAIDGEMRAYDVRFDDDLTEDQTTASVQVVLVGADPVMRVRSVGSDEAISAIEATAFLLGQMPLPPLARVARAAPTWAHAGSLRTQTTWLLSVLLALLVHDSMELKDVTAVAFERSQPAQGGALTAETPHVGSAQLRGQHVLDSQSACAHIESGETLRSVSAMVRFTNEDQGCLDLPCRVTVERDFVTVMTGFAGYGETETREMHRRLEGFVATQMDTVTVDAERLTSVVNEMLTRAVSTEAPTKANLFVNSADAEIKLERA